VRDIHQEDDKVLKIPTDFTDKIKAIHYNSDKNLMFITCRDGKYKIFKLPSAWGSKEMDELDNDIEFHKRQMLKELESSKH